MVINGLPATIRQQRGRFAGAPCGPVCGVSAAELLRRAGAIGFAIGTNCGGPAWALIRRCRVVSMPAAGQSGWHSVGQLTTCQRNPRSRIRQSGSREEALRSAQTEGAVTMSDFNRPGVFPDYNLIIKSWFRPAK
jgi:hypothetical protein